MKYSLYFLISLPLLWVGFAHSQEKSQNTRVQISGHSINMMQFHTAKTVIDQAYQALGIEWQLNPLPSKRSVYQANLGYYDGELVRAAAVESFAPQLVRIPYAIGQIHGFAFVKKGQPEINQISQLNGKRLGLLRGAALTDALLKSGQMQPKSQQKVNQLDSLFKLLVNNRVDAIIFTGLGGQEYIQQQGLEQQILKSSQPLFSENLYHYLHKDRQDLINKMNALLGDWQATGKLARLVDQSNIKHSRRSHK